MEHQVGITHLRDTLGIAVQHVANHDEPIVIRRYRRTDVVMVPLWEWRWLKRMEHAIRAGGIDVSAVLREIEESGETWLADITPSR